MTYTTGGNIQATDYNTFVTLANGMNEIFGDIHPGATTLPNAGFGYGQSPVPAAVVIGQDVTAAQWSGLFTMMRSCGTHQGTPVVPPLPTTGLGPVGYDVKLPVPNDVIIAENNPTTLSAKIAELGTNKYNIAALQSNLNVGSNFGQPPGAKPWTNTLTWNYQVNFGSWNNARYFFNSGGTLNLNGSYTPNATPEDAQWISMFATMSPLVFDWSSTSPNSGTGGTSIGFYNLDPTATSWSTIYYKTYGVIGYYTNSSITVNAKYNAAAGTSSIIDFQIILTDGDLTPNVKTSTTTYRVDNRTSSGAIVYPGGPVGIAPTFVLNDGFIAT